MAKNIPTAREITSHRVNGLNEALRLFVTDSPGQGGACHEYVILIPMEAHDEACYEHNGLGKGADRYRISSKPSAPGEIMGVDLLLDEKEHTAALVTFDTADLGDEVKQTDYFNYIRLSFQNGPIKENGINGISHEALLAVLIDRLEGFQSGQFKCHDNQVALDHLQSSRLWLHKRTMDRVARQVEGTNQA